LLACDRWFSPGTPASSTTKTGHHDIAEILLKVALNTKNQNKSDKILVKSANSTKIKPQPNIGAIQYGRYIEFLFFIQSLMCFFL
jgi:hypothetical protein